MFWPGLDDLFIADVAPFKMRQTDGDSDTGSPRSDGSFRAALDVAGYKPNNVKVQADAKTRTLTVTAEEKGNGVRRFTQQSFFVPECSDLDKLEASIDARTSRMRLSAPASAAFLERVKQAEEEAAAAARQRTLQQRAKEEESLAARGQVKVIIQDNDKKNEKKEDEPTLTVPIHVSLSEQEKEKEQRQSQEEDDQRREAARHCIQDKIMAARKKDEEKKEDEPTLTVPIHMSVSEKEKDDKERQQSKKEVTQRREAARHCIQDKALAARKKDEEKEDEPTLTVPIRVSVSEQDKDDKKRRQSQEEDDQRREAAQHCIQDKALAAQKKDEEKARGEPTQTLPIQVSVSNGHQEKSKESAIDQTKGEKSAEKKQQQEVDIKRAAAVPPFCAEIDVSGFDAKDEVRAEVASEDGTGRVRVVCERCEVCPDGSVSRRSLVKELPVDAVAYDLSTARVAKVEGKNNFVALTVDAKKEEDNMDTTWTPILVNLEE